MTNPLFDRVLPADLADRAQVIEIEGEVGDFSRLAGIVEADLATLTEGDRLRNWEAIPVTGRLAFEWVDAERTLPAVRGRLTTRLAAVCQRCLEAFELPLDTAFDILFTGTSVAEQGLEDFDTWELGEDPVRLLDVVEEALIMALPLAPVHISGDACGPLAGRIPLDAPEKVRPFADLRSQLEKANK